MMSEVKFLCCSENKKKQMLHEVSMKAELMNHEGVLNFMNENKKYICRLRGPI